MTTRLDDVAPTDLYTDETAETVDAPPHQVWHVIESIGGELGWYAWAEAWGVRGLLDSAVGGPGVRLTRPDRRTLEPGDTVDWWRVEVVEPGRLLRLRAETRLPGTAWLDLAVTPRHSPQDTGSAAGQAELRLTTSFLPRGLAGRLYWLSILPLHGVVFGGLSRRIIRSAHTRSGRRESG